MRATVPLAHRLCCVVAAVLCRPFTSTETRCPTRSSCIRPSPASGAAPLPRPQTPAAAGAPLSLVLRRSLVAVALATLLAAGASALGRLLVGGAGARGVLAPAAFLAARALGAVVLFPGLVLGHTR